MRNRISNVSYAWINFGSMLFCIVSIGIFHGLQADSTQDANKHAYAVICAVASAFWVVVALPWQLVEQHRPGQAIPAGSSYLNIGLKNAWTAAKEIRKLKQAALYLLAFFIITDTISTLTTVISVMQNTYMYVSFSTYIVSPLTH
jgi:MFS-type transporter involved in bile tolerance (Atg22 family)